MSTLPQVEIIKPWRGYCVGAVIRPVGVLRQFLLQNGLGKMMEEKPRNPARTKA